MEALQPEKLLPQQEFAAYCCCGFWMRAKTASGCNITSQELCESKPDSKVPWPQTLSPCPDPRVEAGERCQYTGAPVLLEPGSHGPRPQARPKASHALRALHMALLEVVPGYSKHVAGVNRAVLFFVCISGVDRFACHVLS